MRRSTTAGLLVAGVALVLATRALVPSAPPLYEGITPTAPFNYCSPPSNLASSNIKPTSGQETLTVSGGTNELGQTGLATRDQQVIGFFGRATITAPPGATTIVVSAEPDCSPPAPPPGATIVGNVYKISAHGQPGDAAIDSLTGQGAQVLLRVPPSTRYTSVKIFAAGAWQNTEWTPSPPDSVNLVLLRFGEVAAINVPSKPGQTTPGSSFSLATLVEAVLVLFAIGIIVAAIAAQRARQRSREVGPPARGGTTGRGGGKPRDKKRPAGGRYGPKPGRGKK